jgi:hypothetical protein
MPNMSCPSRPMRVAEPSTCANDRSKTLQTNHFHSLNLSENGLLELALNLLSLLVGVGLAVEVKKSTEIELWCLEELDLSDVDL